MEFTPSDRLAAEIHFAKARESLRALSALLHPLPPGVTSDAVRAAVTSAVGALEVAAHALEGSAADAARVPCPYCPNRVIRTATLCGSCWRKLDPARES